MWRSGNWTGPVVRQFDSSYLTPAPFYLVVARRMLRSMTDELADSALMLRYRDGDGDAFEVLYARHRSSLYRFLLRQSGDQQSCEDIFQETWSKVIRARHNYRPDAQFSTYLYRIARNSLIDHYRRVGRQSGLVSENEAAVPEPVAQTDDPVRAAEQRDQRELILAALDRISDAQREVFLLREEAGCSLAEIAAITGVGHETVKSRLRYALLKLRSSLPKDAEWRAEGTTDIDESPDER